MKRKWNGNGVRMLEQQYIIYLVLAFLNSLSNKLKVSRCVGHVEIHSERVYKRVSDGARSELIKSSFGVFGNDG
jgi:hypothetical protein